MDGSVQAFVKNLATRHRVLVLGGHAVIYHGYQRSTLDADIWLEPMATSAEWSAALADCAQTFPETYFWNLATRARVKVSEVADVIEDFEVIRLGGLSLDLDVFRKPNNMELDQFDEVWHSAKLLEDSSARVLDDVDLL